MLVDGQLHMKDLVNQVCRPYQEKLGMNLEVCQDPHTFHLNWENNKILSKIFQSEIVSIDVPRCTQTSILWDFFYLCVAICPIRNSDC